MSFCYSLKKIIVTVPVACGVLWEAMKRSCSMKWCLLKGRIHYVWTCTFFDLFSWSRPSPDYTKLSCETQRERHVCHWGIRKFQNTSSRKPLKALSFSKYESQVLVRMPCSTLRERAAVSIESAGLAARKTQDLKDLSESLLGTRKIRK